MERIGHLKTKYGDLWISNDETLSLARMYLKVLELELNCAKDIPEWMKLIAKRLQEANPAKGNEEESNGN